MGQDVVDLAIQVGDLPYKASQTSELILHGAKDNDMIQDEIADSDAQYPAELPLNHGMVQRAVNDEMARRVDDVLARRTRCLLLDAQASVTAAPQVARTMQAILGTDDAWRETQVRQFQELAAGYICTPS